MVVIGGSGQAGTIHVKNLVDLGADVACYDIKENATAQKNYYAKETSLE